MKELERQQRTKETPKFSLGATRNWRDITGYRRKGNDWSHTVVRSAVCVPTLRKSRTFASFMICGCWKKTNVEALDCYLIGIGLLSDGSA
ncbi:unnamed protein product [Cylicocyclus nassatus]|uniref:Uncharacterized protein n=1 Tax=Cylicocyclus nassatus TaxID=53992 RepID=A0AA36DU06_CYLNA|nr:unnamed protein product [Cylicocyclus nassatus]